MIANDLLVRELGVQPYLPVWRAMQAFTNARTDTTPDEIWLLEHTPVFTQGQNGKAEHVLNPGDIPIVQSDRGGQVTYHGPGQLMFYTLIDIQRKNCNVRSLVTLLEMACIAYLGDHGITAEAKKEAPGVYIQGQKIASIGLRVRHGRSYHGLAFNIDLDLSPFERINPCGFKQLKMTDTHRLGLTDSPLETGRALVNYVSQQLGYESVSFTTKRAPIYPPESE